MFDVTKSRLLSKLSIMTHGSQTVTQIITHDSQSSLSYHLFVGVEDRRTPNLVGYDP